MESEEHAVVNSKLGIMVNEDFGRRARPTESKQRPLRRSPVRPDSGALLLRGAVISEKGGYLKGIVFLTEGFYRRCEARCYREIERKVERPYFVFVAKIDGVTWGLPFRSSIRHPYAFWTNRAQGCGIDYTKAVVIEERGDIDRTSAPHIREHEFAVVKGGRHEIIAGFQRYVKLYKKARV